jgi:hypothetical protein
VNGAATSFTDSRGVLWTVREEGVDGGFADSVPPERPLRWLTFETDLEVRRLWTYPDDWRRMAAAQLDLLCRRANTMIARFPRRPAEGPRPSGGRSA